MTLDNCHDFFVRIIDIKPPCPKSSAKTRKFMSGDWRVETFGPWWFYYLSGVRVYSLGCTNHDEELPAPASGF
jgi:hypothetical protein